MQDEQVSLDKWLQKKISLSIGNLLIIAVLLLLCFFVLKATINRDSSATTTKENGLEIGSLLRKVKMELMKSDTERINKNENALFKLKDFQMEISFTVRTVNKDGAKVDYKFVTVEGGSETGNENVQKLILRWDAIAPKKKTMHQEADEDSKVVQTATPPKK